MISSTSGVRLDLRIEGLDFADQLRDKVSDCICEFNPFLNTFLIEQYREGIVLCDNT